jgi:excisionase family DNA binding protein
MEQDTLTVNEAAQLLGTTKEKIARLVRQGVLTSRVSVVDARRRLIPRAEVERILRDEARVGSSGVSAGTPSRPRPRTAGMYTGPLEIEADEVDDYLRDHWRAP